MKDDYLKPVMDDDPLLMYDIDEDDNEDEVNEDDLNSIQHLKKWSAPISPKSLNLILSRRNF